MDVNNSADNPDPFKSSINKKELILFVEDDIVNQMLGRKMLAKAGYDIEVAGNGQMALEMLKSKNYSVVITDIKLPHMTGFELAAKIRKSPDAHNAGIPIIAVSAFLSTTVQEQAKTAGINEFISKPFILHDLQETIEKLLKK